MNLPSLVVSGVGVAGADPVRGGVQPADGPGAEAAGAPIPAPRARHLRRLPGRGLAQADLRHLQPRNARANPGAADVRGAADQRHGRLLPHVARQVHAGHAAPLRLLAQGDDEVSTCDNRSFFWFWTPPLPLALIHSTKSTQPTLLLSDFG